MKKIFLCLLLIAITFSLFAQSSETEKERRFSIQISPILLTTDIFQMAILTERDNAYAYLIGFEFQYALTKYFTLSIEPRFGLSNDTSSMFPWWGFGYGCNMASLEGRSSRGESNEKSILFSLNPGLVYKPFGTMLKGWYIGIYSTIGLVKISRDSYYSYPKVDDSFFLIGITGGTGYQWVFRNGFTISLGGALGKTWDIAANGNTGVYDKSRKFKYDFIINFKLGYSF